jgi:triosephosphate isomerase (TIM)
MSLIIANWKMNFTLQEAEDLCAKLIDAKTLIISPPTPYLGYLANKFPSINFASGDISVHEGFGAYTGEYSGKILKSCGVRYVIIGHAERRGLFGEDDGIIKQKISNTLRAGLVPIICIGESLEVRKKGLHDKFIIEQLGQLPRLAGGSYIIAYEPLWSIGTGDNPSPQELKETFKVIKNYITKAGIVNNTQLVYGGSVAPNNIKHILDVENIDGALIGSASLSYENLKQIIQL